VADIQATLRFAHGVRSPSRDKLWVMNRDGSQVRQLTTEGVLSNVDWSPDGSQIAYVSFTGNDTSYVDGNVWILNVTTLEKRQLTVNQRP